MYVYVPSIQTDVVWFGDTGRRMDYYYQVLHNSSRRRCVASTLEERKTFGCNYRTVISLEERILRLVELTKSLECPSYANAGDLQQRTARRIPEYVSGLSFSSDGSLLVASSGENIHTFDPNRGKLVLSVMEPHDHADIANLSFYSDRKFFCSTTNGCIGFWDARKLDAPLNYFKAHSNYVSKVLHDTDTNWLLTADKEDGQLQYWYLPALEIRDVKIQENHYGRLANCPALSQMCIVEDGLNKKLVMSSSSSSSLYIINNLNLETLSRNQQLQRLSIGENLKMYLSMNPKVAQEGMENSLQYLEQDEFIPAINENIHSISYMENFPHSSVISMRLTTSNSNQVGKHFKDWTVCIRLKDRLSISFNLFQSYGSNVMHECLLYSLEEPRYCGLKEKKNSISPCNRLIASPQKSSIKLLSFSDRFHDIQGATKPKQHHLPSIFSMASIPKSFHEHAVLKCDASFSKAYPLCCKFSPLIGTLAVGNSNGHVSFYQPRF